MWRQMKPETIARRAAQKVIDDTERKANLLKSLKDAAAREVENVSENLWIYAGPDGMLAEFITRHQTETAKGDARPFETDSAKVE